MGVSTEPIMLSNLQSLVTVVPDIEELTLPFLHTEIEDIVRKMPTDKALGPDDFNGMFMKRCWQTIKHDFYALCEEFYNGSTNLECIHTP